MKYTKEELERMINSEAVLIRLKVVKQGYRLDKLVNDKNLWVREEVARQGYGLEKLIFDTAKNVRMVAIDTLKELVEQGKAKLTIEIFG